ncbi:SDR family NAD(P)-dependent oxidoreductase [Aeromicrobium sp. CTD01-1L150]|uniref:SDR family NAD(P)-dependent oxidoreductase n=1 Tax=Aeromicrobium sp. CTD01-1L150 TaxID=3341830 RepID=UPI0035C08FDA
MESTGRLTGRTALVTGGGSGIGAATAELFAREGAKVVVADINGSNASVTVERIQEDGSTAEPFAADVSDESQVKELVDFAVRTYGSLDVLQNYASERRLVERDVFVAEADAAVWTGQLGVDLMGCVLTAKHAVPHMISSGGGSITNATSLAAWLSLESRPAYATAKAAVIGLTKTLATEYGKEGVRTNAIAPGHIVSPATERMYSEEQTQVMLDHVSAPRLGRPDDVALAALFLASPESSFINGQVIVVDGGMSAYAPMVPSFRRLAADS